MNTITIKNLSTLSDFAAIGRVAYLMAGDDYGATHDSQGEECVTITCKGNTFTVLDR